MQGLISLFELTWNYTHVCIIKALVGNLQNFCSMNSLEVVDRLPYPRTLYKSQILVHAKLSQNCKKCTVAVNKRLSFCIRSTIVVHNEIHSFAVVVQYDTFMYFRVKVWCNKCKSFHTLHHSDIHVNIYWRQHWFTTYTSFSVHSILPHHHGYKAATTMYMYMCVLVDFCARRNWRPAASTWPSTTRPATLKEGLDQNSHGKVKLSDPSLFICLSRSLIVDMYTSFSSHMHLHVHTELKIASSSLTKESKLQKYND